MAYEEQAIQFDNESKSVIDEKIIKISIDFDDNFINKKTKDTMSLIKETLVLLEDLLKKVNP